MKAVQWVNGRKQAMCSPVNIAKCRYTSNSIWGTHGCSQSKEMEATGVVSHHHLQLHVEEDTADMVLWHPDKASVTRV